LGVNAVQGGFAGDSFRASIGLAEECRRFRDFGGGSRVLRILVVEDDSQLAVTLKYLVEDNPRYRVVAMAEDADGAIAAAEEHEPDLVLLDLHLARGTTGFSVAVRLNDLGVPCLFVSGKAPRFPMPDLALGCLMKPFTAEDVHRSLALAEDLLRGRETLRPKQPENLTLYEAHEDPLPVELGYIPSKRSLRTRLEQWISGYQQ
jgi:CheY-like chemotaxis protein